jgi:hypothetical protein
MSEGSKEKESFDKAIETAKEHVEEANSLYQAKLKEAQDEDNKVVKTQFLIDNTK